METKDRLIQESDELFSRYGIKSVTMDDIAVNIGVSKKTIYQHFKDKNELVLEVLKVHMNREKNDLERIKEESSNAIQEVYLISKYLKEMFMKTNPSVLFDLKKYHSEAYEYFQNHKSECIESVIISNIESGILEGNYRSDFTPKIMARLRMTEIEGSFDPSNFPTSEFDFVEVQVQSFKHFVMGLATKKGEELFVFYANENKN